MEEENHSGPQSVWWALFSLKGRIRRLTYALASFLLILAHWFVIAQIVAAVASDNASGQEIGSRGIIWVLLLGGLLLVSAWVMFALNVKRLHDIGFPGWPAALVFAPLLALIDPNLVSRASSLATLLAMGLCFWPGNPQDNPYGPPPVKDTSDM